MHHDLAILSRSLTEAPGALKVELDVPDTLAAAHAMQKEVADEAFVLGAELFAERPRSFRKRFDKYFAVWRAQTAAAA